VGAAMSASLAGFIIVGAGYSAAFLTLAAVAAGGFLLYFFCMPETKSAVVEEARPPSGRTPDSIPEPAE
jgi:hypothetical protein